MVCQKGAARADAGKQTHLLYLVRPMDILQRRVEKEGLLGVVLLNQLDGGVVELKGTVRAVSVIRGAIVLPKVDKLAFSFGIEKGTE